MTLQQNSGRIQTTHIGSLPRPHHLLDRLKAKFAGQPFDEAAFASELRHAVVDVVKKQKDCGIDIVTDGEFSKPGFSLTSRSGSPAMSRARARKCCCSKRRSRPFRNITPSISSRR
jgi:hypothetical protein